ncbi:MAG: hypothetical protein K0S74_1538 [Chlamydiales bacterium]|jgi:esterase/lipase|nr:hypothetical protein [Chlamydiales bacterium]
MSILPEQIIEKLPVIVAQFKQTCLEAPLTDPEYLSMVEWEHDRISQLPPQQIKYISEFVRQGVTGLMDRHAWFVPTMQALLNSYIFIPGQDTAETTQIRQVLVQLGGTRQRLAVEPDVEIDSLWFHSSQVKSNHFPIIEGLIYAQPTIQRKEETHTTAIVCTGQNSTYEYHLPLIAFYLQRGINVVVFNYRGSGNSSGVPSEQGYYADAEKIYNEAKEKFQATDHEMIVHGISLGGGVAAEIAHRYPGSHLVLDQTFTSIADATRNRSKFFLGSNSPWVYAEIVAQALSMQAAFDNAAKIAYLESHILIARTTEDELMPPEFAKHLQSQAKKAKTVSVIESSGYHGSPWYATYLDKAAEFENFLVLTGLCKKLN